MSHRERHLSDEEIAQLLRKSGGDERSRSHVASCDSCQFEVQALSRTMESTNDMMETGRPTCPSPDVWIDIAAGGDGESSARLLDHAATCLACGARLRELSEVMTAPISAQEDRDLSSLATARSNWQDSFAHRAANHGGAQDARSHIFPGLSWRWLVPATVGLAIVLAAALTVSTRPKAGALLSDAYAEQRVLEMRLHRGRYAPLAPQQRGAQVSIVDRPKLAAAVAAVAKEDKTSPSTVADQGRVELMSLRPDEAIMKLTEANHRDPTSAAILGDLGAAYAERGIIREHPEDLGTAVECFTRALRIDPKDASALFNRALAYQKLQLNEAASDDWRTYLRLHGSDEWSSTAQQYLDTISEQKKKN